MTVVVALHNDEDMYALVKSEIVEENMPFVVVILEHFKEAVR